MIITIRDIILTPSLMKDEDVIYAKRIDGSFTENSGVTILELTEEEKEMSIREIVAFKCPGFDYFLEAFLITDMLSNFDNMESLGELEKKIDFIIHYAEFDA